ncbi:hypothetical protein ATI02_4822 [Pseudomonas baetica]|uniref:Uncharacterized protein n=1 Tax=Pseudomonas baetica TaxID=674054 RepID=A0ABX4Q4Z2_9PSED|nr:hypothetical protein ATI02_4822 [Pseudomonas baetica]
MLFWIREKAISWQIELFATHKTKVGASLLAKRVCQSTLMPSDPPLSRAGSLPPGECDVVLDTGKSHLLAD